MILPANISDYLYLGIGVAFGFIAKTNYVEQNRHEIYNDLDEKLRADLTYYKNLSQSLKDDLAYTKQQLKESRNKK